MITVRADPGGGPEHVYQLSKALLEIEDSKIFSHIASPEEDPYWEKYKNLIGEEKLTLVPHRKFSILTLYSLYQFIITNKIDFIHSHGKGAGIYSRLLSFLTQIPCVHSFHGVHIGEYNYSQKFLYITLEKILSLFTYKVVATSKSELETFLNLQLCNEDKIELIYNGVQVRKELVAYRQPSVMSPNRIFSMVRYTYQKNVEMQLEIAKNLREKSNELKFEFLTLGTGETKDSFVRSLDQQNLKNYFNLIDFSENRYNLMQNSLCYLSTSRWEGMPLSLIEAMACGLPVVATSVPGNVDLVSHNETGFLFNQDSPEEAASYIKLLSQDQDLRTNMSAKAYEKAVNFFSSERMAEKMITLYNKYYLID